MSDGDIGQVTEWMSNPSKMFDVSGQTAIVTGASGGIGNSIIEKLYTLPLKLERSIEQGIGDWMQDAPMDAYLRLVRKSKDRITTQVNGLDTSFTKDIPATGNKNLEQAWGYEVEASVIHRVLMKDEVILVKRAAIDGYDIDLYSKKMKRINQQGKKVTENQISNMSNINQSFNLGKNCNDLVYFVEDDYIHNVDAIGEMIFAYERISSQTGKELILCPTDYPYLYTRLQNSKILLGNKYHWRSVDESLCTFLTSKKIINKHFKKLISTCEFEHFPFEKPFHEIYKKELCISPMPALAIHYTNINSIYGLSPFVDYKKLWNKNKS